MVFAIPNANATSSETEILETRLNAEGNDSDIFSKFCINVGR